MAQSMATDAATCGGGRGARDSELVRQSTRSKRYVRWALRVVSGLCRVWAWWAESEMQGARWRGLCFGGMPMRGVGIDMVGAKRV